VKTEDKQIDGLDLELLGRQEKSALGIDHDATAVTDGALPMIGSEHQRDIERQRGTRLIDAMRQILDAREGVSERQLTARSLDVSQLGLPEREAKALEALQDSVVGRKSTGEPVFAEDRRELLEQALAVLQPNLTSGKPTELADLQMSMSALSTSVGELRELLESLEDAQEELIGAEEKSYFAQKPKPGKPPEDPDAPRPPTSLTGGPEAKREDKPSMLTGGPEAKRDDKPSTLSAGPAVKDEPEAPTTLGDAAEIAEVEKKKPWWRRPLG
jgi:hypothetical protein